MFKYFICIQVRYRRPEKQFKLDQSKSVKENCAYIYNQLSARGINEVNQLCYLNELVKLIDVHSTDELGYMPNEFLLW